jgi:carbonic anhydrase
MSQLSRIMSFNQNFVSTKAYQSFLTDRFPDKKIVIVTCMDTRLTELLPKAMNLKNGDAKFIKVAGAVVAAPFGSVMRSILVAIYLLGAKEIYVIGHHDCGMTGMGHEAILRSAREAGIDPQTIDILNHSGIDLESWLSGFDSPAAGVRASVRMIRDHPLLPPNVDVHGMLMDPSTGKLELLSANLPQMKLAWQSNDRRSGARKGAAKRSKKA